jgi:phospholipase/carboxylesterase
MSTKQLSLQHLVGMPSPNPEPAALYPTILALHGRGSHEGDLIELAPHLPQGLLWVSPRAPLLLGPDSYEWYRVRVIGKPDPDQVLAAIDTLERFIGEMLAAYPVDPTRLFLLGFSQGSMLSLCYTVTHPQRIAGVIAQSGYLPNNIDLEIREAELVGKPFLLTHGVQDTMIPVEWDRVSRDRLQQFGVDLTYHEFQMGHTVSMESLEVISGWLQNQLGRTRLDR